MRIAGPSKRLLQDGTEAEDSRKKLIWEEDMVNIAVLGYGTVGSGVVEVINTNHKSINKRAGARSTSNTYWTSEIFRETLYRRFWYMIMRSSSMIRRWILLLRSWAALNLHIPL